MLPPTLAKVNCDTLARRSLQPFVTVEIASEKSIVLCRLTADSTVAADILEVHDWALASVACPSVTDVMFNV